MAWLKRLEDQAKIPIILITGGDPASYEKEVKMIGPAGFFHKSGDLEELFAMIRKILGQPPTAS